MPRTPHSPLLAALALTVACGVGDSGSAGADALGPVDGRDLPPADTGRVAVGDMAPDFTLEAHSGDRIRLSDYRGAKEVVLVFYRGHW